MTQETAGRDPRWQRLSLVIMGVGIASLIAAAVLFVLNLTDGGGYSGPKTTVGFNVGDALTPEPTPTVVVPPSEAPVTTLAIPEFGVDAPIVVLGVDANGIMESPDGPTDVAWYDFSSKPGFGSNAVFSGHVDYYNYGPAVFWNLKDLEPEDIIEVRLEDGTVYQYGVVSREMVNAQTANIGEIVGDTANEIITLITCGGTFDASIGEYDQRVVVRAQRLYEPASDPSVDAAAPQ